MKLKKHFTFSDKKQIWRLLISDSDKLIIETRDTDKKEVFFHCIDLKTGKKIFKNLQLEEKFWIGIEAVYNDIIFFHHFAKPNMPEHKKIFAYDINNGKIIWSNDELSFLTIIDETVYAFIKKFEGQNVYALNFYSGEIVEEFGNNAEKLNELMDIAGESEDYSDYRYPENSADLIDLKILDLINSETAAKDIINNAEFIIIEDLLLFNYYVRSQQNLLDNEFAVYNIVKKKKLFSETLNRNLNSFSPDSFFCFKNVLLLLKNKNEIISFTIK